jgi:hypothetical protein
MTKTTPTKPVLILPTATSQLYFAIPTKIVKDGRLNMLSGDALALYLFIARKLYRCKAQSVLYENSALALALEMTLEEVREARQELRAHRLIDFKPTHKSGNLYWFVAERISTPMPAPTPLELS